MNANNEWHRAHGQKNRSVVTIQTLITAAKKPQYGFMAVDRIDGITISNPVFLIVWVKRRYLNRVGPNRATKGRTIRFGTSAITLKGCEDRSGMLALMSFPATPKSE